MKEGERWIARGGLGTWLTCFSNVLGFSQWSCMKSRHQLLQAINKADTGVRSIMGHNWHVHAIYWQEFQRCVAKTLNVGVVVIEMMLIKVRWKGSLSLSLH